MATICAQSGIICGFGSPSGPTGGRGAVLALVLPMLALSVGLAALALATNARVERPLSLLAHLIC